MPLATESCSTTNVNPFKCFHAGEFRTSENLELVSIHTLFNREHNRIATELAKINPKWNDETLYLETRRIVIALLQHITYNEWLPLINGSLNLSPLNSDSYYQGYNSSVGFLKKFKKFKICFQIKFKFLLKINPALNNEFSTAAFRFGHSLIRQKASRYDVNQNLIRTVPYNFQKIVFQTDMAYE